MKTQVILIVDDDIAWVELLELWLKSAGYQEFYKAQTGQRAVELAKKCKPDCVVLDLTLPDIDGIEVCKMIRAVPELGRTPIVMITAHRKDKLAGQRSGADYFIEKDDNPAEFLETIRAVFRRQELDDDIVRKGDIAVNIATRRVYYRNSPVATLTPATFHVFYVLLERSPEPVGKELLYSAVSGKRRPELSRALDISMNRLRKALPVGIQRRIKSVKGFGYVYLPPPDEKS